jgi:hypothetical protein
LSNIFSPLASSNPLVNNVNNTYDDGDELSFTQPAPQLGSKLVSNLCNNDSFIDERQQNSFDNEDNDEKMNFSFTNDQ